MGVGSSSQPQPVCSQLMDRHMANGWELRGGDTPVPRCLLGTGLWGGWRGPQSLPGGAEHPHGSAPGWVLGSRGGFMGLQGGGRVPRLGGARRRQEQGFFSPWGGICGALCGFHMGSD